MSVITDETVRKAWQAFMAADRGAMRRALNAVLPDLLEEAAKVVRRYNGCHREFTQQIADDILALAEDTATVQEKGSGSPQGEKRLPTVDF